MSPYKLAVRRLKTSERMRAQQSALTAELKQWRKQQDSLLLNGTSDIREAIGKHEGELIRMALRLSNKSVTKAAEILGVSYQWLGFCIDSRHPELLTERSPIYRKPRRK